MDQAHRGVASRSRGAGSSPERPAPPPLGLVRFLIALGAVGGGVASSGCQDEPPPWPPVDAAPPSPHGAWSRAFPAAEVQSGEAVAVDGAGDVVVGGVFLGTVDFGDGAPLTAQAGDAFLLQLHVDGATSWARRYGERAVIHGLDVSADGGIAAVGTYQATIDVGCGPMTSTSSGVRDLLLAKMTGLGDCTWSRSHDSGTGESIVATPGGTLLVAGEFGYSSNVGCGAIPAQQGLNWSSSSVFVAKLDGAGGCRWARAYANMSGFPEDQRGPYLAATASDATYVAGAFWRKTDCGGGVLETSDVAVFVAHYDPSGAHLWSRRFPEQGAATVAGLGLSTDAEPIVVVHASTGGANFGDGVARHGLVLVRLDAAGEIRWSRSLSQGMVRKPRAAVGDDGSVWVAGDIFGEVDFGGGAMGSGNGAFAAKYDGEGNHLWSAAYPWRDGGTTVLRDLAPHPDGGLVVVGSFDATLPFAEDVASYAEDDWDLFVVKIAPTP